MQYITTDEKLPWNFITSYFSLLVERINSVDSSAVNGNLPAWYRNLKIYWLDVKDLVRVKLFKDDYERFDELHKSVWKEFNLIKELIQNNPTPIKKLNDQISYYNFSSAEDKLLDLQSFIYTLVHESDIILPNPERKTAPERIIDSFGGVIDYDKVPDYKEFLKQIKILKNKKK